MKQRRPRRVAIIGTRGYPSYYGGFETAVRKVAPFLSDSGWQVVVYGRRGSTRLDDPSIDHRVVSITTRGVESKSISTLSYGFTASLDAILLRRPDVVLVMNVANGFFLPLFKLAGIPTLVNVDGIEWERKKWGAAAKAMFRAGARLTARFGSRLVYDARAIADRWKEDFGVSGVFIPYGGDEPGELPVMTGLAHRGYALVVARFVPENTIAEFVLAARTISSEFPVVIVGSSGYGGDIEDQVRLLAEEQPDVTWLGHVSDDALLFSLFQHAGAYFHGHSVGGTNPALVQAMSCAAPIVARDTVYNREVLGEGGAFVDADPVSIAEGMLRTLRDADLMESSSGNSRARARAEYTWQIVCAAYERELSELVCARSL